MTVLYLDGVFMGDFEREYKQYTLQKFLASRLCLQPFKCHFWPKEGHVSLHPRLSYHQERITVQRQLNKD